MTCVKFCGITRACDIESINALHHRYPKTPLYVGFVFYAPSKRAISASQALQLKGLLAADISTVGVFVNEQPAAVAALLNSGVIDYAQLHGSEDEAYIARLRELTKKPLIQAFCVKQASDIERARPSSAAMVLLDAGKGEGARFNWSLLGNTRADAQEDAPANRKNDAPESPYTSAAPSNESINNASPSADANTVACSNNSITSNDGTPSAPTNAATANASLQRAYLLAGGLSPENVFVACELCHPFGVDVSSGIETQGAKDPAKMQQFLEEVVRFDTWNAAPSAHVTKLGTQPAPCEHAEHTTASAEHVAKLDAPPASPVHAQPAPVPAHAQPEPAFAPAQAATNGTSTHSPCSQRRHHD